MAPMAKIKIALFVLSEVLAAIDGLARSLAQSRSEVMRAALDIGVESLQRQSGKAGPPETASRLVPGSSRPSRPRRETLWHCPRPRDWKVGDVLYERAQRILEERPNWERTAFKKRLQAAVSDLQADDPAAVVERVLNGTFELLDEDPDGLLPK